MKIPVSEVVLTDEDTQAVNDAVKSGWISSSGPLVEEFEHDWASYCGRRHGVSVSNGTAALWISLAALNLEEGDEVILPTFTIISCILAVIYTGATPVLVDADPVTWTMDVNQIADRITPRTKAIMVVHIYGHPVDMDPVLEIAERFGLAIIEDAAEAHGAQYLSRRASESGEWRRCGSFGVASCFSFYANKLITTGEGGMVLTDDDALADRLRSLRNLCFQRDRRFSHSDYGFNFRLTNIQAALGINQLRRMETIIARKRWLAASYAERLGHAQGLQIATEQPWARNVFWMFGIVLSREFAMDATDFATAMSQAGIETRPFFLGMHEQPVFRREGMFQDEQYPVAEHISARGLYLPSGLGLDEAGIDYVSDTVLELLGR